MKMSARGTVCLTLTLACLVVLEYSDLQAQIPSPSAYAPNVFIRSDLERYRILRVDTQTWRDGKRSGIFLRDWSGLPDHCWAIQYTYVWNDESSSPGHRSGSQDPEPVIVFVSDAGRVVGVQSRLHGQWLPINTSLSPFDFVGGTHIILGFAANVHTPAAGLFPALLALGFGNVPSDLAAAARTLESLVRSGRVSDTGY